MQYMVYFTPKVIKYADDGFCIYEGSSMGSADFAYRRACSWIKENNLPLKAVFTIAGIEQVGREIKK